MFSKILQIPKEKEVQVLLHSRLPCYLLYKMNESCLLQTIHSYCQFCGGVHHEENNVLQEVGKRKSFYLNQWSPYSRKNVLGQPRGVGWGGRWEGGSRGRGHIYTYGWFMLMNQKPTQYCKAIIHQLKINNF